MSKTVIQSQLAHVDEAVRKGELELTRQRQLIEECKQDKQRTADAYWFLDTLEWHQWKLFVERQVLRTQLEI